MAELGTHPSQWGTWHSDLYLHEDHTLRDVVVLGEIAVSFLEGRRYARQTSKHPL